MAGAGFSQNPCVLMKNAAHPCGGATPWVPTGQAVSALGISRSTLHRWVGLGLLVDGAHYRNGLTARSPRRWNLCALEARIEQLRKLPDPLRPDSTNDPALAAAAGD